MIPGDNNNKILVKIDFDLKWMLSILEIFISLYKALINNILIVQINNYKNESFFFSLKNKKNRPQN